MKRANSINDVTDINLHYTAWDIIIFGTGNEYPGFEPKNALLTSACSKMFNEIVCKNERQETYWKEHVQNTFKSYENDYRFKVSPIWSRLFCNYSNEICRINFKKINIIKATSNYCLEILESKDSSIDKTILFGFLQPLIPYLSLPSSNPIGQYCLAKCYSHGYGIAQNPVETLKYLKLSADQGNAQAQNNLGFCYQIGNGIIQNPLEAFKYLKLSADQGYTEAQYNLGYCYHKGFGVAQNPVEAFKYYKLSADQGNVVAQNNLGFCYRTGFGTTINPVEAFKYLKLSADQGLAEAQCYLGFSYKNGFGTTINPLEAFKYLKLSADQGLPQAQLIISNNNGFKK